MPLYDFNSDLSSPKAGFPTPGIEPNPVMNTHPPGLEQLSDVQAGRTKFLGDSHTTHPDYIEEFLMPGFRALDEGMKNYWSGMRIPTKDNVRAVQVKIAGGDKTLLAWRDQMVNGRVKLPVASLNRVSWKRDPRKFSPPYLSMQRRYTSNRLDRMALVKRPVPFLVTYELIVWTSFKLHAEYILHQVLTRFNPLAEFMLYDEHVAGTVVLACEGSTDASDKEIGADDKAKVRYEFNITAEAWLPLPETIVPTILGQISSVRESDTSELLSTLGIHHHS